MIELIFVFSDFSQPTLLKSKQNISYQYNL